MLIYVSKERIIQLVLSEIKAWESVGGGPNLDAYEFDPETVDTAELRKLGYYVNRDAWIAGIRIKALYEYLNELTERGEDQ